MLEAKPLRLHVLRGSADPAKYHDEIITVHEGRLRITLENKEHIVTADDGGFLIPRWHKHSMGGFKGEKLVVREETIPGGMFKAL